jgi:hypothetical protein
VSRKVNPLLGVPLRYDDAYSGLLLMVRRYLTVVGLGSMGKVDCRKPLTRG